MQYPCTNVLLFKKKNVQRIYIMQSMYNKKIFLRSFNDQTNFCLHFVYFIYILSFYSMHLDEHLHSSCKQLKFALDGIE